MLCSFRNKNALVSCCRDWVCDGFVRCFCCSVWSLVRPFVAFHRPESALASAEGEILQAVAVTCPHQKFFIDIGLERRIWTLSFNSSSQNTPLVLLHGLGTGCALWMLNFRSLAKDRPVYAIDILGFGRSSRPNFSTDPVLAEIEFIESIETWRKKMRLELFILLGHCFGGFLAASYAVRYPDHVRHLILVDPWGFSSQPRVEEDDRRIPMPSWVKTLGFLIQPFNPLAVLRAARSWGPLLVKLFKPDLIGNYKDIVEDKAIAEYIYEWNALLPTGETAFKHMMYDFGWAIYPMLDRIKDLHSQVSITNIFGSRSWVDSSIGLRMKRLRQGSYVETQIVSGAGHYVFAERADLFNRIVNCTCLLVDYNLDLTHSKVLRHERARSRSESTPDMRQRRSCLSFARRRNHHNSVCLAEGEEEEDEFAVAAVPSPIIRSQRPTFNISGDEEED